MTPLNIAAFVAFICVGWAAVREHRRVLTPTNRWLMRATVVLGFGGAFPLVASLLNAPSSVRVLAALGSLVCTVAGWRMLYFSRQARPESAAIMAAARPLPNAPEFSCGVQLDGRD